MPDQFTVTTRQSGLSRITGSIGGIFVGLLMVLGAFPLLWWNEGRAVKTARGLSEGASLVVHVAADAADPANEGKLVHLTAQATTAGTLTDGDFGVSADAIKLIRTVEMFQWQEKKTSEKKRQQVGGSEETTTTYTYSTAWSDQPVDSSSFQQPAGHSNPGAMPWASRTLTADTVTLGAFALSPDLVAKIDEREDRRVGTGDLGSVPEGVSVVVSDGRFYKGQDPQAPRVGDVRVRYQIVKPLTVSVVGVQRGNTFDAFRGSSGTSVLLLQPGTVSAVQMFETAQTENAVVKWVLRGVGFLLMFLGVFLVFRPIAVVGSVIPLVGRLLSAGLGAVALLIALTLSLVTIALAWLAYRPLFGIALLAVAACATLLLLRRGKRAAAPRQPPPLQPPPLPTA